MDALAKALAVVFAADPTWYAQATGAAISLHDCLTVLDWVEDPTEGSPETTKSLGRVVKFLYSTGRLPLSDKKVAREALAACS